MLHLASLFVHHQAGLPAGSAPYSPLIRKDLRSSGLRVLSMLKTASKISALNPELFVSRNVDLAWSLLYSNIFGLNTDGKPTVTLNSPFLPTLWHLLEMLPSLAAMLINRQTSEAAGVPMAGNVSVDLGSQEGVIQTSANVLMSVVAHIRVYTHHGRFSSPTLSLTVLMSPPVWTIMEAVEKRLSSSQAMRRHSSSIDSKTMMPLPSAPSREFSSFRAPELHEAGTAVSLAAFLTFLVDRIFCLTNSLPSALVRQWGDILQNIDTIDTLDWHATSVLKLLSDFFYEDQLDSLPDSDFLSNYTEAISSLYSEPLRATSVEPEGPLDQLSALSHILSSHVWDVLIDLLPEEDPPASWIIARMMTVCIYQAVAIVEKRTLSSLPLFSSKVDGPAANDFSLLSDCKLNAVKLVFVTKLVVKYTDLTTMQPLYRSSLRQLRAILQLLDISHFVPRDWELIMAELRPFNDVEEVWGVSSCCNTACTRLEGSCEVEVKTLDCGGGCGTRYCCRACQEQSWRAGHRSNCRAMKELRDSEAPKPDQTLYVSNNRQLSCEV